MITPEECRAIRERLGLTQGALAARLGYQGTRRYMVVWRWESGDRRISPPAEQLLRQWDEDAKKSSPPP